MGLVGVAALGGDRGPAEAGGQRRRAAKTQHTAEALRREAGLFDRAAAELARAQAGLARHPVQVHRAACGHDGGNGAAYAVQTAVRRGQSPREHQEARGSGGRVAQFLMQAAAASAPEIFERRPAVHQVRRHIAQEEAGHAGTEPYAHKLRAGRKRDRLLRGHGADNTQAAFRPENDVHASIGQDGVGWHTGCRVPAPETLGERRKGARIEFAVVEALHSCQHDNTPALTASGQAGARPMADGLELTADS